MTTATTLAQDVAKHWNQCLEVNSSWRQFTHELAVLNTFDTLHIEDCEFVADLLENTELFENENFSELLFTCFEFASELVIDEDLISAGDLHFLVESGLTFSEVIELATEKGIAAWIVNDFAEV